MTDIEWARNPDGTKGKQTELFSRQIIKPWTSALVARFWGYVHILGPEDCWEWTAGRFERGYGQFRLGSRKVKAHRCALELSLGRQLGVGMHSLHKCDNPPCCNPSHLFEGTIKDNVADMYQKGRHEKPVGFPPKPGEQNPAAKLKAETVLAIRILANSGKFNRDIASQFGMSASQIGNIVRGDYWKDGPWPQ